MLHHQNKPEKVLYATRLAKEFYRYGGTLLFFNSRMIDLNKQMIMGYRWTGEEWTFEKCAYPDIIYLSGNPNKLIAQNKDYQKIFMHIPYITHQKGSGMQIYKRFAFFPKQIELETIISLKEVSFYRLEDESYQVNLYGMFNQSLFKFNTLSRANKESSKINKMKIHHDQLAFLLKEVNHTVIINLNDLIDENVIHALEKMALEMVFPSGRSMEQAHWVFEIDMLQRILKINHISNLIYNTFLLANEYTVKGEVQEK
jgi:hypothetical protein